MLNGGIEMVDEKIIEDFYMMWGNFPASVRLIHKNRTILAANEVARSAGFEVGIKCFNVGVPEAHVGCKANETLSTKKGLGDKTEEGRIRYWLPVKECDEVYVHITISTNVVK
jgi:hypothetical protein